MEPTLVQSTGFSWTAAGAWATFIALLGVIIKQVGPWRKQTTDAEQKLRDDLLNRVERLEDTLERERLRHEAERSLDRHRLNNVTQCLDAVLMMLEAAPEKAQEIVARIRAMRDAQIIAEATEKATIHAAEIEAGHRNEERADAREDKRHAAQR